MFAIDYLTTPDGQPKAAVIPIELWRQLFPEGTPESVEASELAERIEDYCMNKAMDEGKRTPLMSREDALVYLEE
jgi:hypothetical protein